MDTSPIDIPGAMSIDESETLLDSSLASDFQPLQPPSSYVRDTSMGSINTQSTTLTCASKLMSPAVTVDIDFNQKRMKRRKSYDGITDEMGAKGSVLRAIESNQNIVRDTLDRHTSGEVH